MPLKASANGAAAKAKARAAAAGARALSLSSSLGNSESEPWLQPQSEMGQRLRLSEPARRDGAAKGHLCCPAGERTGKQKGKSSRKGNQQIAKGNDKDKGMGQPRPLAAEHGDDALFVS